MRSGGEGGEEAPKTLKSFMGNRGGQNSVGWKRFIGIHRSAQMSKWKGGGRRSSWGDDFGRMDEVE